MRVLAPWLDSHSYDSVYETGSNKFWEAGENPRTRIDERSGFYVTSRPLWGPGEWRGFRNVLV